MFHRVYGIQDCVCTVLLVNCERSIAVLHLISCPVITQ